MALLWENYVFDGVDVVCTGNLSIFLHLLELIRLVNSYVVNQLLDWGPIIFLNGFISVTVFYLDLG